MGLLQPVGYADIPSEISGKSFGEQLEILRNIFGCEISQDIPGTGEVNGKKIRLVVQNNKVGIFMQDVGLLCFNGEYFHDNMGLAHIGISHPEDSNDKEAFYYFITHNQGKCSGYLFQANPNMRKMKFGEYEDFDNVRILNILLTHAARTKNTLVSHPVTQ